jgi:hypothetical protein
MIREIPPLQLLTLKSIAKTPNKRTINEGTVARALAIIPPQNRKEFDVAQILVDYITDAGRLTDDVCPPSLFNPNRTTLSLTNTKISSKYIDSITSRCPNLVTLDVGGTFQVDDNTITLLLSKLPQLTTLNVRNCRKVTDSSLEYITSSGREFSEINIGGCVNITLNGIQKFMNQYKSIQNLKVFNLSGIPINSDTLRLISLKCKSLTALQLGYAEIDEESLKSMLEIIGGSLINLNVSWIATGVRSLFDPISTEFISEFLVKACPKLKILDICGLKNINLASIMQYLDLKTSLALSNPNEYELLQSLRIKFVMTPKITLEQTLLISYPNMKLEA